MTTVARRLRLSPTDTAITLAVVAWALAEAASIDGSTPTAARVAFAMAVTLPMAGRNRFPAVALAIAAGAFVADLVFQLLPLFAVTPIQLLPLATYAVVSLGRDRRASGFVGLGAIVMPPALFVLLAHDAPVTVTDIISLLVTQTVATGAGWAVRLRREEAERQAQRLVATSVAADDVVREGLDAERSRIAWELRAIVARNLAVMERELDAVLMAGSGGRTPGRVQDALAAVAGALQRRAADVMAELQRLLSVLHDQDPGVAQPVSVSASVAAARMRGWNVDLEAAIEAAPGATLAAGRVTEEVLAGHPPDGHGGVVRVRLSEEAGGLRVRVSGASPAPVTLEDPITRSSMRERVRLHGGTARIVRRRRRWLVDARLPAAGTPPQPLTSHLLGDVVVLGAAALIVLDDARTVTGVSPFVSAACGTTVFVVPLALRRRAPLLIAFVIAIGLLALELGDVLPDRTRTPIIAALLGAGASAMHVADPRRAMAGSLAVAASAVTVNLLQLPPGEVFTDTPIILFMAVMAHGFGRLVRENVERTKTARDSEELVAIEQLARLRAAVDDERRSVARDLHDVVAHGVSLIGVLAGAAQAQAGSDPVRARASLDSARASIVQVRVEVGRLTAALGVDEADAAPLDLSDLAELIDTARRGGQDVTLEIAANVDGAVQAGVAASAYRIVQESLTNARKHARGAPVRVSLARDRGHLLVEVQNARPPVAGTRPVLGTGLGIDGMRERARLLGGQLAAESSAAGGFAVRARLPLERAARPARCESPD